MPHVHRPQQWATFCPFKCQSSRIRTTSSFSRAGSVSCTYSPTSAHPVFPVPPVQLLQGAAELRSCLPARWEEHKPQADSSKPRWVLKLEQAQIKLKTNTMVQASACSVVMPIFKLTSTNIWLQSSMGLGSSHIHYWSHDPWVVTGRPGYLSF